jgi:ABC-2 type transport system ATP-binding protein
MLKIINARKAYHHDLILDIPRLELDEGIYWIKGQNGSGKTTLLRMIAGMSPFEGEILCAGISLRKSPQLYRRRISWAEAEPAYPPFVRGQELLAFYRHVRKAPERQTEALVERFGIRSCLSLPVGQYSDGMVKRLSLLLAFVGEVSLILLDEPLATLDAMAAAFLPQLIQQYRQEYGASFLFTSHQPIAAGEWLISRTLTLTGQTIRESI